MEVIECISRGGVDKASLSRVGIGGDISRLAQSAAALSQPSTRIPPFTCKADARLRWCGARGGNYNVSGEVVL